MLDSLCARRGRFQAGLRQFREFGVEHGQTVEGDRRGNLEMDDLASHIAHVYRIGGNRQLDEPVPWAQTRGERKLETAVGPGNRSQYPFAYPARLSAVKKNTLLAGYYDTDEWLFQRRAKSDPNVYVDRTIISNRHGIDLPS